MAAIPYSQYLSELKESLLRGDSTEHTYRPALKSLLEAIGVDITATNEPRRIVCGSPDFQITRGKIPLGHVETKDIGANLDEMERGKGASGAQFIRYRDALSNWILTDYLEFRWFVNGEKRLAVRIAELDGQGRFHVTPDGEAALESLLHGFFNQTTLTIGGAKDLAERMAAMTRIIRDLIVNSLKYEQTPGGLHGWLEAFRETLLPDLKEEQFADMFAQTLAYGLFAARVHAPPNKEFSREMAAFNLPRTNPFLRKLFSEIAGVDMPEAIAWAVDDIVDLLRRADMAGILRDFGKSKGKEDPVVHFYETFLAAYDPKMREARGVYYTPEPVVSYIVRSVDHLLKTRFNRPKGLVDEDTLILDPATGTATFLYFVIDFIHQSFAKQKGAWDDYVARHLINRVFGFEILMAPYAVAHLKLGMQLGQTGYKFGSDQRLGIYLTNTLEEAAKKSEHLFARWVAEEANAAAHIKSDSPIMVVLGNPPYSNFGQMNRGKWILNLLDDYKRGLEEKKLNLDDDFIKFIRFAQWRIERTGHGIIGFVTNNTYLDGLTHRRMRECLLGTFSEIYILNLHGSAKKNETTPDGSPDENVFDIQQGVAICLFVKTKGEEGCKIHHADVWGRRESKYQALLESDVARTRWTLLKPTAPHFYFVPKNTRYKKEYETFWAIGDVFEVWQNGLKTDRDELFFDFDRERLNQRMQRFFSSEMDDLFKIKYRIEASSSFDILGRRGETVFHIANIKPCLYRPFDLRWLYYDPKLTSRPAEKVMRHMLKGENLALICLRQSRRGETGTFFVGRGLINKDVASLFDIGTVFPLYLYEESPREKPGKGSGTMFMALFEPSPAYFSRRANLNPKFIEDITGRLGLKWMPVDRGDLKKTVGPDDVFHYAYAIFHSPTYRTRYAEFLKTDFPRLPLTNDIGLFRSLAAKGAELVALHTLESPKRDAFITEFPETGDNKVEKPRYTETDQRVWINSKQYFGGVPKAVWEFHVGGYQVCEKWLKDRKTRSLTCDDLRDYQRIISALNNTVQLMGEIDALIPQWPLE